MLPSNTRPLARLVLLSLMLTFVTARLVSILIMLHRMPNIYLHVRDTHVHHLNYGIFLLAGVGAYLLFSPGPAAPAAAVVYGIGLGLTFDEFGMWLHLNGDYWQRASFDAVIVLAAGLGLAGFAPPIERWRPRLLAAGLPFLFPLGGSFPFGGARRPPAPRLGARPPFLEPSRRGGLPYTPLKEGGG